MKKYIVSVVMGKTTPGAVGYDAQGRVGQQAPEISIQNVVGVTSGVDAEDAYHKVARKAKLQHPDHNIVVKVVIEANAEDLED